MKNVRRQVLVPLTLTFLVLISVFLYSGYRIRQQGCHSALTSRFRDVHSLFVNLVSKRLDRLTNSLEQLTAEKGLQGTSPGRDLKQLRRLTDPLFESLVSRHSIKALRFYDLQGETILRFSNPDVSSPSGARDQSPPTTDGHAVRGLQMDASGNILLRTAIPWKSREKVIGHIEMDQDFGHLLESFKVLSDIDFLVVIDGNLIPRMDSPVSKDAVSVPVVVKQTLKVDTSSLFPLPIGGNIGDGQIARIIDGIRYLMKSFPLENPGGEKIGEIVFLQNMTSEAADFRNAILRIAASGFLLCASFFAFSFRVLGGVDRQLTITQKQLLDQYDHATKMNSRLEIEISERRRAEEDLRKLNDNLEHRVAERTLRLERMNREIVAGRRKLEQAYRELKDKQAAILHQDKMACIGQLAAGVAHDINNPIGFIASNLDELTEYLKKITTFMDLQGEALRAEACPETLGMLERKRKELQMDMILSDLEPLLQESLEGAERISKIVRNLRNFSRADEVQHELADIRECLESTINITANELRYKAEVKRNYGDVPRTRCYPQQLNQVFMNLLINAAQAIEHRGEVTVRTWTEGHFIHVSISDTGCGIPKENLKKIFEPFFTTKEVGQGTGLGLSITYDIIKKHNGDIQVESEPGRGTTFTVRLPIVE